MDQNDSFADAPLKAADWALLNHYRVMLDGLSTLFGQHVEFVLHSLEDPEHSVIKVCGALSGRHEGAGLSELARRMLDKLERSGARHTKVYYTRRPGGAQMRSITIAIRNEERRIIGLLCIHMSLNVPLLDFIQGLLPGDEPVFDVPAKGDSDGGFTPEMFVHGVDDMLDKVVANTIAEVDAGRPGGQRNRQVVQALFSREVFGIKDAVRVVAEQLGVSVHTVYHHLRQVKAG
ncbi:PAS domain-containing protein [Crenobacter sp. SG2303]|uniref:PAS domain-containing protein n=1 Tax=Crenobacter oryzisoli TaxID=3056844 RepID=A0ABT7XTV2_9NEIS|nr:MULTISPECIES: PAS domain-containing protein [unclassified Crenobacter]MDN0077219.1 PAS domain-containing protein [Crenobacter sp. SG2303]MDN0085702.1 PAS domain-containing protein [Crenobacter sp. SG2305]